MQQKTKQIKKSFKKVFGYNVFDCFYAPTKIDLLGNMLHFVNSNTVSLTINYGLNGASHKRDDKTFRLVVKEKSELLTFGIYDRILADDNFYLKLVKNIYNEFNRLQFDVACGLDCLISYDIPSNVSLFSNEVFSVLIAKMIAYHNTVALTHTELAKIACNALCASSDKNYLITDFLPMVAGEENKVIVVNSGSLEYDYCPLTLPSDIGIYLVYSDATNLIDNDYLEKDNTDCTNLLKVLQEQKIDINSLLKITHDKLTETKKLKDCQVERIKYFISETNRVKELTSALITKDYLKFYSLIVDSHDLLAKVFDVTTSDCNTAVYTFLKLGALASREIIDNSGNLVLFIAHKKQAGKIFNAYKRISKKTLGLKLFLQQLKILGKCERV